MVRFKMPLTAFAGCPQQLWNWGIVATAFNIFNAAEFLASQFHASPQNLSKAFVRSVMLHLHHYNHRHCLLFLGHCFGTCCASTCGSWSKTLSHRWRGKLYVHFGRRYIFKDLILALFLIYFLQHHNGTVLQWVIVCCPPCFVPYPLICFAMTTHCMLPILGVASCVP